MLSYLSIVYPDKIEYIKMLITPAIEYKPLNMPRVSLGKFLLKIESTDICWIIVATTIKEHTQYENTESGSLMRLNK